MKYAIGAMLMLCALGCDEKKEPAPTAPTASAVPVVSASATASAAQAAAPEASKAKLNGKSLSDVEMKDIICLRLINFSRTEPTSERKFTATYLLKAMDECGRDVVDTM